MPSSLRSDDFMEHAMRAWGSTIYRLALNQTQSPQDADDICQDVFLRLLKDETVFGDNEHMKAWLLRVTINRCHDLHRSAWRRHVESIGELEGISDEECYDAISPASQADSSERVESSPVALGIRSTADRTDDDAGVRAFYASDVGQALAKLPDKTRMIVHLHYCEGYSTEDIARLTRCLPATVRSRLRRARGALKNLLEQEVSHESDECEQHLSLADGPHRNAESGA